MNKWKWIKRRASITMILVLLFSIATSSFSAPLSNVPNNTALIKVETHLLIVNGSEGLEYCMLYDVLGENYNIIEKSDLSEAQLEDSKMLIVPSIVAKSLSSEEITLLVQRVANGAVILTEENTKLSKALGVQLTGRDKSVNGGVNTTYLDRAIRWPRIQTIEEILISEKTRVIFEDSTSTVAIGVQQAYGEGQVIYYARAIADEEGDMYKYFPYAHEAIERVLAGAIRLKRDALVTYFDWGYYYNTDPKEVAKTLKENGVRQIHYSGWYDTTDYWHYTKSFIEYAHSYGIKVYLWLELPMVTEAFWNKYPQWRQKTATGNEAKIDWRYLMALEIPDCMIAVKAYYKDILDRYNWDGVDLAELYFESPGYGIDLADIFTPMSDEFRKRFENKYAIDPKEIFNSKSRYYHPINPVMKENLIKERQLLLAELNESFLVFFENDLETPLDVVLTMIDVEVDQHMSANIGIDSDAFIDLQNRYHYTLNIEDPFTLWSLGPDRYKIISENYRKKIGVDEALTVDINIVSRLDTQVPHSKQTGIEFLNLLWESSQRFNQVAIYASHTPYDNDFRHASYALAHPKVFEHVSDGIRVVTDDEIFLEKSMEGARPFVNGRPWPAYNKEGVFLTQGAHYIEVVKSDVKAPVQLLDIAGVVKTILQTENGVTLSYNQKQILYVSVDSSRVKVFIDGLLSEPRMFYNNEAYYLQLPRGAHSVEIIKDTSANETIEIVFEGRVSKALSALTQSINGSTMIQAAQAARYHEGKAVYDKTFKTVTINLGYYSLWTRVGAKIGKANGLDISFSQYPRQGNNDVLIPLLEFYEALGYEVKSEDKRVIIE